MIALGSSRGLGCPVTFLAELGVAVLLAGCFDAVDVNESGTDGAAATDPSGTDSASTRATTDAASTTSSATSDSASTSTSASNGPDDETTGSTTTPGDTDTTVDETGTSGESGDLPACHGTPTSCEVLNTGACTTVAGCAIAMYCSGEPDPCTDAEFCGSCAVHGACTEACDLRPGCVAEGINSICPVGQSTSTCTGTPTPCADLTDAEPCTHTGCSWDPQCEGEPTACASLREQADCEDQPGCHWS